MNKLILLASVFALSACGYAAPDAGEEGVLVRKPWFFGSGGVDPNPVKTGSTIVAGSTDVIKIPVRPIAFDVQFNDLMPKDGIPLDFHTTVRMQVVNSPVLVEKWNGGAEDKDGNLSHNWFWGNIAPQYTNFVRQEVKNYDMAALAFNGAAIDAIDNKVQAKLVDFIKRNKMPVRLLSVTIGRAAPPQAILNQRTETAAQQQREQTMHAQERAEGARKAAEQARAEADNAYRSQMSLSPEQFVELKRIEMQRLACQKGTCIFGNGTPIISR